MRRLLLRAALRWPRPRRDRRGRAARRSSSSSTASRSPNFDIEQRTKFIQLSTHKTPTRKEVIEELIDEKLKIQLGQEYGIEGIDNDVDNAYANMAQPHAHDAEAVHREARQGRRQAPTRSSRASRPTSIWSQMVRGTLSERACRSATRTSSDSCRPRSRTTKNVVGYEYTLRPILFVVPRGSPPAAFEARSKEAEALRAASRVATRASRSRARLRDVAVREQVSKCSADLPPPLREILDKTEVGQLTAPEPTPQGIQMFALCGKKASRTNTPAKKEVRDEMFNETFERAVQDAISRNCATKP